MIAEVELSALLDEFAAEAAAFPADGENAPERFRAWFTQRYQQLAHEAERPWGTLEVVAHGEVLWDQQWPRFAEPPGTVKRYTTVEAVMAFGDEIRARITADAGRFASVAELQVWLDAELMAFRGEVPQRLADMMLQEVEGAWSRARVEAEARGWPAPNLCEIRSIDPVRPGIGRA